MAGSTEQSQREEGSTLVYGLLLEYQKSTGGCSGRDTIREVGRTSLVK